jgi:RND family efflux transporter MFP subunit
MAERSLRPARPAAPMPPVALLRVTACQRHGGTAAALVLTLSSLNALTGCQRATPPPPPPAVQATPLKERAFSNTLDTVSTLEAYEEVELAAQAGGRVQRLLVRSGDAVRAGQLLLVLDQTQLRAEVASLQAQAERDRLNDRRYDQLVRQGAASAIQRDAYRAAAVSSRESLRARQADLAYKDLRAPIAGMVGDLTVKPGDVVQAGTPIGRLIRNQRLLARIDVPTNRAKQLNLGQTVELLDAAGRPLVRGRIESLDPGVSPSSQTLLARAAIGNPGALRNGQRLRTRVLLGEERRLAVPFGAVTRQAGQAFVFVIAPGQRAALRPVRLGALQGADYPLLAGLEPADQVITSSTIGLRNGLPVRLRRSR